jgi:AraC family transcriptional regulator
MGRLLGVTPRELVKSGANPSSIIELDTLNARRIATPR